MRTVNKVILMGNLTRDPELKQTQSGQPIVTFGIATNRQWITRDGRKESSAEFHEVVAWARVAEICYQYLKKGKLVYIEGYLKTRKWNTEDGQVRYKTEVVVQDMIMLEKRPKSEEAVDLLPKDEEAVDLLPEGQAEAEVSHVDSEQGVSF